MGMSQSYGLNPGDCDDMIAVLRGAVEHGVAFFDTAEVYGPPSTKNSSGKADIRAISVINTGQWRYRVVARG
jgi:aryl-alcohol dehydrogenase-like predicted oxidoreductase